MAQNTEQSYYEIALTNRQVIGVFVVLLTCLVVAFLAGVWVGRGGAGPIPESVIAEAPPRDESALEEMEFFASEEEPRELGLPSDPAPRQEAPPREPERPAAAAPTQERPEPVPPSEPVADPFFIQVFSSSDPAQAGEVRERLRRAGFESFVSAVEVEGLTMHRVRVGPFGSQGAAEAAAETIRTRHRLDTWVTQRP